MDSESQELLKQLEEENGSPLLWRTYAFFLVPGKGPGDMAGGLLYIAGNKIIFEDFPPANRTYHLFLRRRKEYTKYKVTAPIETVEKVQEITMGLAQGILRGKISPGEIPKLNLTQRLFKRTMHMVLFRDGSSWLCELYDYQGLKKYIRENI